MRPIFAMFHNARGLLNMNHNRLNTCPLHPRQPENLPLGHVLPDDNRLQYRPPSKSRCRATHARMRSAVPPRNGGDQGEQGLEGTGRPLGDEIIVAIPSVFLVILHW